MISSELSRDDLIKETRKLIRNIGNRIENIEGLDISVPLSGVKKFKSLNIPKNLRTISDKDLTTLYRELKDINEIRTTYVKGATNANNIVEPLKEKIESFSKETQDKIWDIYGKFYERTGGISEHYKYEVFTAMDSAINSNSNVEEVERQIQDLYDETLKELGSASDAEIKLLYTKKLKSIFK